MPCTRAPIARVSGFRLLLLAALASLPFVPSLAPPDATAAIIQYAAEFEPEAVGATGSGSALLTFDTTLDTMRVQAVFSGLSGNTTDAHVHCCTANPGSGSVGVATIVPRFTGWPTGGTAGSYDLTYDTTLAATFNATFINNNGGTPATALAALLAGLDAGRAYFNVHSSNFPGGEIRGFLTLVPEPGTALLVGLGLGSLAASRRVRR